MKVAGIDDVVAIPDAIGSQTQFSIEFTVSRKHDHLAVIFSQTILRNVTFLRSNVTRTLRVKCKFSMRSYVKTLTCLSVDGPLRNISDSTVRCVNVSGSGSDESRLDASGLFQDPGNPTSTVQWTWDNGSPATGTISGMRNSMLNQRVTDEIMIV